MKTTNASNARKELKELLLKLSEREATTGEAITQWEQDPESAELERVYDEAYNEEFNATIEATNFLAAWINVEVSTARQMIMRGRDQLLAIIG